MGSSISRGTSDVIFILFPFVLSAGLIIMIVICWWKCKLLVDRRGSGQRRKDSFEGIDVQEPDFGHLINIQEYAENQVGTTILYADSPGSSYPHPYVYFSDGRITRIVPLSPSSMAHALHQAQDCQNHDQDHEEQGPSVCNNVITRNNNNENLPSASSSSTTNVEDIPGTKTVEGQEESASKSDEHLENST